MSKNEVNLNIIGGQQEPRYTYKPVILQSNMANNANILEEDALRGSKKKYIIRWNFDLNGQTLTVGSNCLIEFDGGSLTNGTLVLDDTLIISSLPLSTVLNGVTLQGSYHLTEYCDLSEYQNEWAILPLNKVYVNQGLPVEQRTYVSMVGGLMHNNVVFAVTRGNEGSDNFPYPSSLIVFTTANNSVDKYVYNNTYNWDDAPEALKRLYGWKEEIDPLDVVMCNIKDYSRDNKKLPLGKAYHYDGLPVESRYFVRVEGGISTKTILFAVSRGLSDSQDYPYPQSIIIFIEIGNDYKFYDIYNWEDADAEYKKLFGWKEPEPTPEPEPITGDQLADSVVDNEDLCFNSARQIQFKDKAYTLGSMGKGRKYLRKNIQPNGIPFDGIVEGSTTYQGGVLLGIYYDIINDYFVAKINRLGTIYYCKYTDVPDSIKSGDYSDPSYYDEANISQHADEWSFLNREDNTVWKWANATSKLIQQSTRPVSGNILMQSMINEPNTIYHVQYDYHLNFGTIKIPSGSVLIIDGGSFSHGTINLNGCRVAPDYMSLAELETENNALTITGVPADGAIKTVIEGEGVNPPGNQVWTTIGGQWIKIFED